MTLNVAAIIVWVIVGALAGTAAAATVRDGRRSRASLLINTIVGMLGAVLGGFLFDLLQVQIATLAAIQINAQQLLAAFLGALFLILIARAIRRA